MTTVSNVAPCVAVFPAVTFNVRYFALPDGSIWWVGKDVATALGYKDTFAALKQHVDEEDKQNWQNTSFESPRGLTLINESGLYSLILSSKLPQAKAFKRWITSEVLPSIRKTGFYKMPAVNDENKEVAKRDPLSDPADEIRRNDFLTEAWEWLTTQFDTQNLTASERIILIELFKQLYKNFWKPVNISASKLAKLTGQDPRTIKNALTRLLTKKILWCSLEELQQGYRLNF